MPSSPQLSINSWIIMITVSWIMWNQIRDFLLIWMMVSSHCVLCALFWNNWIECKTSWTMPQGQRRCSGNIRGKMLQKILFSLLSHFCPLQSVMQPAHTQFTHISKWLAPAPDESFSARDLIASSQHKDKPSMLLAQTVYAGQLFGVFIQTVRTHFPFTWHTQINAVKNNSPSIDPLSSRIVTFRICVDVGEISTKTDIF